MDGLGQDGKTTWWHVDCLRELLAVVQSRAEEAKTHHAETPEIQMILHWVRNPSPPMMMTFITRRGEGQGKTAVSPCACVGLTRNGQDAPGDDD